MMADNDLDSSLMMVESGAFSSASQKPAVNEHGEAIHYGFAVSSVYGTFEKMLALLTYDHSFSIGLFILFISVIPAEMSLLLALDINVLSVISVKRLICAKSAMKKAPLRMVSTGGVYAHMLNIFPNVVFISI